MTDTAPQRNLYRWGLFVGLATVALLASVLGEQVWRLWSLPVAPLPFADLRPITGAADALAAGLDPLVQNPGDPWGRPMTYPRVWLVLARLGVTRIDTVAIGIAEIVLFISALWALGRLGNGRWTAVVLLLHTFSPVAALAVERGNNDMVVFALVTFFGLAVASTAARWRAAASAALLLATVLKLFPLLALPAVLALERRRALRHAVPLLAASALYFLLTCGDLAILFRGTPRAHFLSYGMHVVWPRLGISHADAGAFAVLAVVLAATLLLSRTLAKAPALVGPADPAFLAGAGIFTGTFVLGSNWDYRLIFLMLTVPRLVEWARVGPKPWRRLARIAVGASLLSHWHLVVATRLAALTRGREIAFFLDEAANWCLFATLLALLVSWVRTHLRQASGDGPSNTAAWPAQTSASG